MRLLDFFGREAGQDRRQALAALGREAEQYIPPNLRPLVGLLSEMTPSAANERAAMRSEDLFAPNRKVGQRVGDFGGLLSEVAGVVAPVAVAGRAGMPAAEALQEALLGFSAGSQQAGRAVADRLNQPGPVPTMYSNPLMGGGTSAPSLPAPRNEAEAMARQVLEMRAAGNAGDVTEDMMALADDQYMFANTPLPMDEASRMARAGEMGYEGGLLHGTGSDIVRVETSRLGEKQNVLGKGFYQTTSPRRAERYVPKEVDANGERVFAEGGNVLPLMTKSADEFDLTSQTGRENINRIGKAFEGSDFDVELRDGGDTAFIRSKSDPNFNVFLDSYAEGQNTLMRLKDAFGNNNLTPILQEAGFTGVKGVESMGSNVRVNYNPQDIRSRFARFDPEFKHLRNLSAGVGGLGLFSAMPQQEQQQGLLQ